MQFQNSETFRQGHILFCCIRVFESKYGFCRYYKTNCFILSNDNEYDCKNTF